MKTIWKRHGMTGCGTKALGFVLSLVCSGCILGVSLSGAAPFFDNTGMAFHPGSWYRAGRDVFWRRMDLTR